MKYLTLFLLPIAMACAQVTRYVPPSLTSLGAFAVKGGSGGTTLTTAVSVDKGTAASYLGSLDYGTKQGSVGVPIADQLQGLTSPKAYVSITSSDIIGTYRLEKILFIADGGFTYYNRDGTITRAFYDGTGLPTRHNFDLSALDFVVVAPGTPVPTVIPPVTPPPPVATAPSITTQPTAVRVTAGQPATFTVAFASQTTATMQWRKNGSPIAGATGERFTLPAVTLADAGSYDAVVSNASGAVTSSAVTLTVDAGRVKNISVRIVVPDNGLLIAGFVLDTPKTVLIRGIGRSLEQFGVPAGTTMPNPTVQIFNSAGVVVGQNDDYAPSSELTTATTRAGAFGLTSTQDSALLVSLPAGAFTAQLRPAGGRGGDALVEIYDVD